MKLTLYPDRYAVCRMASDQPIPAWFTLNAPFASVTRRGDELSLVVPETQIPEGTPDAEGDWAALEVEGPMEFELTGVLASIAGPIAEAGVSIFALATYDTDVVLVPGARAGEAIAALREAGHEIVDA